MMGKCLGQVGDGRRVVERGWKKFLKTWVVWLLAMGARALHTWESHPRFASLGPAVPPYGKTCGYGPGSQQDIMPENQFSKAAIFFQLNRSFFKKNYIHIIFRFILYLDLVHVEITCKSWRPSGAIWRLATPHAYQTFLSLQLTSSSTVCTRSFNKSKVWLISFGSHSFLAQKLALVELDWPGQPARLRL